MLYTLTKLYKQLPIWTEDQIENIQNNVTLLTFLLG